MGSVKTYQDLIGVGQEERKRIQFVRDAIVAHKGSQMYRDAVTANEYDAQRNTTIMAYQKLLYKVTGEVVPDNYSANYKLCSNFFHRLTTQLVEYLLGNGTSWGRPTREVREAVAASYPNKSEVYSEEMWDEANQMYLPHWFISGTDKKVGEDFDQRLQDIADEALIGGTAFGFWNYDHLEVFSLREFVPLYDEENGALMAGIRFWQVAPDKPERATLYELDGLTDFIWKDGVGSVRTPKRAYKLVSKGAPVDDNYNYDGENYEGFPIIPCWSNRKHKTSALLGMREHIDCYDLIKSGFADDVDQAALIYWTIQNAAGMDEVDLARFVEQMHRTKAALVDDAGATAEAHTMEVPYASRDALLDRLKGDIYDDFMVLDPKTISSGGATTATQIKAAYEPQNGRADELEYCLLDFIKAMLKIAGITDKATFVRSMVVNRLEEVQILLQGADYLPEEYLCE